MASSAIPHIASSVAPIMASSRSIISTFRRSDLSFIISEEERRLGLPKPENDGADIIIFHPGSRNIRIGFAKDPLPKIITNVIARNIRKMDTSDDQENNFPVSTSFPALRDINHDDVKIMASELLHKKSAYLKRKPVPNAAQQIYNFNKNVEASVIAGHNDAFGIDWTKISDSNRAVIGKEALYIHPENHFQRFFPIHKRRLNLKDYPSVNAVAGDLESLIISACEIELSLTEFQLKDYHVALVIPDSFDTIELKRWIEIMFRCRFKSVLITQESLASTFGAGLGSACVVDIGAEQTTVTLVEDGFILNESRMALDYGSDHMIPLFEACLQENNFPYADLTCSDPSDFDLLTELKERTCTLDETEISIQVIDFYVRKPSQPTLSYQFKSYEERYLTPLALFRPEWLCLHDPEPESQVEQEDPEILTFEKTISHRAKSAAPEISENAEGQDDGADQDEVSSVNLNSALDERNADEAVIHLGCRWHPSLSCQCEVEEEMEASVLASHIFSSHISRNESTTEWICYWQNEMNFSPCRRSFNYFPAFESHCLSHIIDALEEKKKESSRKESEPKGSYKYLSLDEAILRSILNVESSGERDRIKRWLGSILLVGGGHLFTGFRESLEEKLRERAHSYVTYEDRVGALISTRDVDPRYMSWKGAAIMSRLEGSRELWITSKEWNSVGLRSFLDKFPYLHMY